MAFRKILLLVVFLLIATGAQAREVEVAFNIVNQSDTYATMHFQSESGLNIKDTIVKGMFWSKKVMEYVSMAGDNDFDYMVTLQLEGSEIECNIEVKATTDGITVNATPIVEIISRNTPNLQVTKYTDSRYNRYANPPVYEVTISLELAGTASQPRECHKNWYGKTICD